MPKKPPTAQEVALAFVVVRKSLPTQAGVLGLALAFKASENTRLKGRIRDLERRVSVAAAALGGES